jgi:hypothetical protein
MELGLHLDFCKCHLGPKKVSIFRAHPFNGPCNVFATNHYVSRQINDRYINSYTVFGFMIASSHLRKKGPPIICRWLCVYMCQLMKAEGCKGDDAVLRV